MSEKTIADYFRDWEADAFGYGYGTGEPIIIPMLKTFFAAVGRGEAEHAYAYATLEEAVGAPAAWLLINRLCQLDAIEYGTSPRFGWLTVRGLRLRDYFASKSAAEILDDLAAPEGYPGCSPTYCNCEVPGRCGNPFWTDDAIATPADEKA